MRLRTTAERTEGDSLARFQCLLEQVHVSLDLVEACVDAYAHHYSDDYAALG